MDPIKEFENQRQLTENIFDNISNLLSRRKETPLQRQVNNPEFDQYIQKYASYYEIKNYPADKIFNSHDLLLMLKNKNIDLNTLVRRTDGSMSKFTKLSNLLNFEPFKSEVPKIFNNDDINPIGGKPVRYTVVFPNQRKQHMLTIKQIAKYLGNNSTLIDMTKIGLDGRWVYLKTHPVFKEINNWIQHNKSQPNENPKKGAKTPKYTEPRYTVYFTNHPITKMRKIGYNLSAKEIAQKLLKNPDLQSFIKVLDTKGNTISLDKVNSLYDEVIRWRDYLTGELT